MFNRLEVRAKAANVAEIKVKELRSIKTSRVVSWKAVRPGDIYGPLPRGGLRGRVKLYI